MQDNKSFLSYICNMNARAFSKNPLLKELGN